MGNHAKYGPSASKRWIACPGSVTASWLPPERGASSAYAAEGTWMHAVAEHQLLFSGSQMPKVGDTKTLDGHTLTWDDTMADAVDFYVEYVLALRAGLRNPTLLIEQQVRLSADLWGTADALLWGEPRDAPGTTELHVIDLKGGRGVMVPATSEQLRIYALAAMDDPTVAAPRFPDVVCTHVVQPRAPGAKFSMHDWDRETLDAWRDFVLEPAVARLDRGDDWLASGAHCQFCPGMGVCPELARKARRAAHVEFGGTPPPPGVLSLTDLGRTLEQAELIGRWITAVRGEASAALDRGEKVPGWKLVQKRATRKWRDPASVRRYLEHYGVDPDKYLTDPVLKTPAQVLKLIPARDRKAFEADQVAAESSGTTLVPDSDGRPEVAHGPQADFDIAI